MAEIIKHALLNVYVYILLALENNSLLGIGKIS